MKTIWMTMSVLGCVLAMTAAAESETPAGGAPKAPEGGRKMMSERGHGMMLERGEPGEAMIMKALAPESPMAKELGLSKEQITALKGVMKAARTEAMALQEKMREAAKRQAEMMSQAAPDEAAVLKGVEELGALRTEIAKVTTRQILAAQKILSAEQREQLRGMINARMGEMRERTDVRERRPLGGRERRGKAQEGGPLPPHEEAPKD